MGMFDQPQDGMLSAAQHISGARPLPPGSMLAPAWQAYVDWSKRDASRLADLAWHNPSALVAEMAPGFLGPVGIEGDLSAMIKPEGAVLYRSANANTVAGKAALDRQVGQRLEELRSQALPSAVRRTPAYVVDALAKVDKLGFDTSGQAMAAIRAHPDWLQRWDIQPTRSVAEADLARKIAHYLRTGSSTFEGK